MTLLIKSWGGADDRSKVRQNEVSIDLDQIHSLQDLADAWKTPHLDSDTYDHRVESRPEMLLQSEPLELHFGGPTRMTELQVQFFPDLVYQWSSTFDDIRTWRYEKVLFRSLSYAILRIAAWGFYGGRG